MQLTNKQSCRIRMPACAPSVDGEDKSTDAKGACSADAKPFIDTGLVKVVTTAEHSNLFVLLVWSQAYDTFGICRCYNNTIIGMILGGSVSVKRDGIDRVLVRTSMPCAIHTDKSSCNDDEKG